MNNFETNQDRTAEYLKKFDREKLLKYLIKEKNPIIFDVGANDGASLDEFKSWWPEAEVHCFEPQNECWDVLDKKSTFFGDSVFINKIAAGRQETKDKIFYTHDITTGQSGFNKINTMSVDSVYLDKIKNENIELEEDYFARINNERTVKMIRLEEYIEKLGVDHINLLKIDTQGFEPEILEGMGKSLESVDVVITELMFYDYYERSLSFSDIEAHLLPAGFQLYDISHISKNPINGRTDWIDVVYINKNTR